MKKKKSFWYWIILIIIILLGLYLYGNYGDKWEEENCDLTFYTYTYSEDCLDDCSVKCSNEGFSYASSGYFMPFLSYEEMIDYDLYKRCECNCEGCRKN